MSLILLLASYCGGEDANHQANGCTDRNPCAECMEMSNVFEAEVVLEDYMADLASLRTGGGRRPRVGLHEVLTATIVVDAKGTTVERREIV